MSAGAGTAGGVKAGQAYVVIGADLGPLKDALGKVKSQLDSFANNIAGVGAGIAGVGAAILMPFKVAFGQFKEAEQAQARLAAVIRASGQAAGYTAEEMAKQANALQQVTIYSDETVMGVQAILSTFKGIKGEQFKEVTELALDLASAMGSDAQSAALQLGKAMNDPEQGLAALTRVGIQFTEEQKKMIKSLSDSGKVAEAQAMVYDRIKSAVGGTAREMGKTFSGAVEQAKNALGDLGEEIGAVVAPAIKQFADYVREILPSISAWIKYNKPIIEGLFKIGVALTAAGAGLLALAGLLKGLALIAGAFGVLASIGGLVVSVFSALGAALAFLVTPTAIIAAGVVALISLLIRIPAVSKAAAAALDWLKSAAETVGAAVKQALGGIYDALAAGDLELAMQVATSGLNYLWTRVLNYMRASFDSFVTAIQSAWSTSVQYLSELALRGAYVILQGFETLSTKVEDLWINLSASVRGIWVRAMSGIAQFILSVWSTVQEKMADTKYALGIIDTDEYTKQLLKIKEVQDKAKGMMEEEKGGNLQAIEQEAIAREQAREQAHNERMADLEQEKVKALEALQDPGTGAEAHQQRLAALEEETRVAKNLYDAALDAAAEQKRQADIEVDKKDVGKQLEDATKGAKADLTSTAQALQKVTSSKLGAGEVLAQFGGAGIEERFAGWLKTDTDEKILDENKKQTAMLDKIATNTSNMTASYA